MSPLSSILSQAWSKNATSSFSSERNAGECYSSKSLSSLDKKTSGALEAMLKEHDEDSVIIKYFLPIISTIKEPDQHSKKTKVLVSKLPSNVAPVVPTTITPHKETPSPVVPEKEATSRGEGSSRNQDRAMSRP
ncbi:hypothetical protein GW17_00006527 [Ensete ventricosum]|nr:hypothetical protein GW17_00006527 [Ensete ventricosum]